MQVDTTVNGQAKTLVFSVTYLPYGRITGLTYGNSLSLVHDYDNQYRTDSILVNPVLDRTYGYDANGNVTSLNDGEAPGNEALETAGIYTYDQDANLLAEISGQYTVTYDYDYNANTVSANNRTYVYDSSNQLIQVLDNSNLIAEYTYNGAGQRIKKWTQSGTRIFHYDLKGHLIAETTQGGTMVAEYVYVEDQLLAMITKPAETEIVSYFHNDHLGTPQVLTNDSQNVVWKAAYTPFGGADILTQTVENPFRLPGQYYDSETSLHYNYFRYYDPTAGRYVTPDPIGLEGGINLFVYAQGNPINFHDPFGLDVAVHFGFPQFPQSMNVFGHAAVAVTGRGVYSYGTTHPLGSSFTDYLRDQATYRDSLIYILPTTQAQDDAVIKAFMEARKKGGDAIKNNCADMVGAALKAAGLIKPAAITMFPKMINDYMMLRTLEGKVSIVIMIEKGNQQWTEVYKLTVPFNPTQAGGQE